MSLETERLIHDNPPAPEQLHELVSIGVRSAIARERLRTLRSVKRAHFFVDELDLLMNISFDKVEPAQVRHRLAARIGARPAGYENPKTWTLKYIDTYFVEAAPGAWIGERSTYRFEWTRERVLMADRAIKLVGLEPLYTEDQELDVSLEHFSVRDDTATILHATEQLKLITADDCDELIADVSNYLTVVESVYKS